MPGLRSVGRPRLAVLAGKGVGRNSPSGSVPGARMLWSVVQQVQKMYIDERHLAFCAFCGDAPGTRDHVPPRVFLDKPYPDNVPVVGSCFECNNGASLDEEYVACLLEAAVCNTV